ncbi:MAG: LysR family transcriptional regulator [Desulfovibrionales bacterium]|nr:LysR family transcriptional regulator [Desulfovibrionales bacterium]
MLNLNSLRIFYTIARYKSIVKAADVLCVSQPAVSNGLKKFQQDIGVELFRKSGRGLIITDEGRLLYEKADELFEKEQELEALLSNITGAEAGSVSIGLVPIFEQAGIMELLQRFKEKHPFVTVKLKSDNSTQVLKLLEQRKIDIAIAASEYTSDAIQMTPYKNHQIFLLVPEGHRLYKQDTFCAADLEHEDFVMKDRGSAVRSVIDEYIAQKHIAPTIAFEMTNTSTIKSIVRQQGLLAFLPERSLRGNAEAEATPHIKMLKCSDADLYFTSYIATHKKEHLSPLSQMFFDMLLAGCDPEI